MGYSTHHQPRQYSPSPWPPSAAVSWERADESALGPDLLPSHHRPRPVRLGDRLEEVADGVVGLGGLVGRVDHQFADDHLGWYFDVGNIVRYDDPVNWVKTLGKRIMKLDIKDYSRAKMDAEGVWKGFDCKIGAPDSSCGWSEVMAALSEVGYEGWASAEVPGGGRERLAEISANMDDVFSR